MSRRGPLLLSLGLLALLGPIPLAACDDPPPAADAGRRDASTGRDAGPDPGRDGGGLDAGPPLECDPGCTEGCPQGCFDLGPCAGSGGAALDAHANVYTAGVVLTPGTPIAAATFAYRSVDTSTWHRGVELASLPDGRWASSAFGLRPGQRYELRVDFEGGQACAEVTTQPELLRPAPEEVLHVQAGAAPGGDGSEGAPFATAQAALEVAGPGSEVRLHPGLYHEALRPPRGGAPGRPLSLVGEEGAILDGADQDVAASGLPWRDEGGGVYSAPWAGDPRYLVRDDRRLYHFLSRAGLESGIGDDGLPIEEGFFVEGGRLYLRSASDPGPATFHVPTLNTAIALDGVDHVWITGLTIRFYGEGDYAKGIDVRGSDQVVVEGNHVHDIPTPIWVRVGSEGARIEGNRIHQSRSADWPWAAVKGTDHENSAIVLSGGRGAIAAHNEIRDIFNGIYTGSFSDPSPDLAFDVDVYENRLADIGDDALEPEGACINHRFWNNDADRLHNGLSLAPILAGPTWAIRNRFTSYEESGFKVSNGSVGRVWLLHNTCWVGAPDHNGMGVSGPFENMVFRNNILHGTRYALEMSRPAQPNDLDYDNLFTTRGPPVIKWSDVRYDDLAALCAATGLECNGQPLAPDLLDPDGGAFGLAGTSPNIDAALRLYGINDAYTGEAPDIGYRERGASERPPL